MIISFLSVKQCHVVQGKNKKTALRSSESDEYLPLIQADPSNLENQIIYIYIIMRYLTWKFLEYVTEPRRNFTNIFIYLLYQTKDCDSAQLVLQGALT